MNAMVGRMQVEQANTGGIQTNLTIPVIESLQIAIPPISLQNLLVDKVNESFRNPGRIKTPA